MTLELVKLKKRIENCDVRQYVEFNISIYNIKHLPQDLVNEIFKYKPLYFNDFN